MLTCGMRSASCQIEFYFLNFNFKIIRNLFKFSSKFENNDKTHNNITYKFICIIHLLSNSGYFSNQKYTYPLFFKVINLPKSFGSPSFSNFSLLLSKAYPPPAHTTPMHETHATYSLIYYLFPLLIIISIQSSGSSSTSSSITSFSPMQSAGDHA